MMQTIFPYHKKASAPPYSFEDKDKAIAGILWLSRLGLPHSSFDYYDLAYP